MWHGLCDVTPFCEEFCKSINPRLEYICILLKKTVRAVKIEDKLREALHVVHCEVRNTSKNHLGHAGYSENSHFEIVVVSPDFDDLTKIARHRMVFRILEEQFNLGIHALSMKLWTVNEYENQ